MNSHRLLLFSAVLLALCLSLLLMTDHAYAGSADQELAAKDGTQLGTKEFDSDRLPGKLEMSLAVGSFFVMIAVVKWL